MKGLLAPQNTFLDSIANHFDGTREYVFCKGLSSYSNSRPVVYALTLWWLLKVNHCICQRAVCWACDLWGRKKKLSVHLFCFCSYLYNTSVLLLQLQCFIKIGQSVCLKLSLQRFAISVLNGEAGKWMTLSGAAFRVLAVSIFFSIVTGTEKHCCWTMTALRTSNGDSMNSPGRWSGGFMVFTGHTVLDWQVRCN